MNKEMNNTEIEIKKLLENSGFTCIDGTVKVKEAIEDCKDDSTGQLCSGFGVFPNGDKCGGCYDCFAKAWNTRAQEGEKLIEKIKQEAECDSVKCGHRSFNTDIT